VVFENRRAADVKAHEHRKRRKPRQVAVGVGFGNCRSDVEAEVEDVAVADDVVLAFLAHLAGVLRPLLAAERDEAVIVDGLGLDEAALDVAVDLRRRFRFGRLSIEGAAGRYGLLIDQYNYAADGTQLSAALKYAFPLGDNFEAFGRGGMISSAL